MLRKGIQKKQESKEARIQEEGKGDSPIKSINKRKQGTAQEGT